MAAPNYITNAYVLEWAPPNIGVVHHFQATSLAAAQSVAQIVATMFQRIVRLRATGAGNTYTYSPGAQGGSVTVPAGIGD